MIDLVNGDYLFAAPADDQRQDAEIGDFRGFVRDHIGRTSAVLELGPGYGPLFPKAEGYNVRSIDHLDQAGLIAKYGAMGGDTSRIEPVDYIWSGEPLSALVGTTRFDFVFASHVVEHATNLVGFLTECSAILHDDGLICLIIPDKRYCFDYLQPLTDSAKVVADALRAPSRHSIEGLYREESQVWADYEGEQRLAWGQAPVSDLRLMRDNPHARFASLPRFLDGPYRDAHEYFFIPSTFRLIMEEMRLLGLLSVRLSLLTRSRGCEFLAVISKRGPAPMSVPQFLEFRKQQAFLAIDEQMEGYRKLARFAEPEVVPDPPPAEISQHSWLRRFARR